MKFREGGVSIQGKRNSSKKRDRYWARRKTPSTKLTAPSWLFGKRIEIPGEGRKKSWRQDRLVEKRGKRTWAVSENRKGPENRGGSTSVGRGRNLAFV